MPPTLLSYGGGVNSTALLLMVTTEPRFSHYRDDLVVAFADPGAEMPETYAYLAEHVEPYCAAQGIEFARIGADYRGGDKRQDLEAYGHTRGMIPHRSLRFCTQEWKILPIRRFCRQRWSINYRLRTQPVIITQLIGIDAGEPHRANLANAPYLTNAFPLIEEDMDRQDCADYLAQAGWPIPRKSGCFFCPFANRGHFIALAAEHPELFARAEQLEQAGLHYAAGKFLVGQHPLRIQIFSSPQERRALKAGQPELPILDPLDDPDESLPCMCRV